MKLSKPVKSAAQNENANNVLRDIKAQEKTQEKLALLNILFMSAKNIRNSKAKGIKETFSDIRNELGIAK